VLLALGVAIVLMLCVAMRSCIARLRSFPRVATEEILRVMKERTDPAELQQWAMGILRDATVSTNLSYEQVPKRLQGLLPGTMRCSVLVGPTPTNSYVAVYWGSGMVGPWGVAIGAPTFAPTQLELHAAYQIKWQDGIYVYYSSN